MHQCKEACLLPCNLAPDTDKADLARVHKHYTAFDLKYSVSTDKQPWSTTPQAWWMFAQQQAQAEKTNYLCTSVSAHTVSTSDYCSCLTPLPLIFQNALL